jgi:hypothetical protein
MANYGDSFHDYSQGPDHYEDGNDNNKFDNSYAEYAQGEDDDDQGEHFEVESDSDASEVIEIDIEKNLGADYKYSGQFGYSFYAALRGDTPGRHLKRDMFSFGLVQLICGIAFLVNMTKAGKLLL